MITPHRIGQETLKYIYESAKERMAAHPERAKQAVSIVEKHPHFKTQKEALEFAVQKMRETDGWYQVWAKVEKGEDGIYRVQNWWLSTDDIKTIEAAEYIGLAQTHDGSMILSIIDDNNPVDDIVAYY